MIKWENLWSKTTMKTTQEKIMDVWTNIHILLKDFVLQFNFATWKGDYTIKKDNWKKTMEIQKDHIKYKPKQEEERK